MTITINRERLLRRFLRYIQIGTTANPNSDEYPSSPGQRKLTQLLAEELKEMSIIDAHVDDSALAWGTIPASDGGNSPTVALLAHVDTSPESPGENVRPQVIESYGGGSISLSGGATIDVDTTPVLASMVGKTLVTSDGSTLLGGDDKAGVAPGF